MSNQDQQKPTPSQKPGQKQQEGVISKPGQQQQEPGRDGSAGQGPNQTDK
jgi:hypothetical protein